MDPNNPVVRLCAAGMQAEAAGHREQARALFEEAWARSADDYERSIAAHYVARHQPDPAGTLRWNLEALRLAAAVDDERVHGFFPSLHLNVGHSYEQLGDTVRARLHYDEAEARLGAVPDGRYGEVLRGGIAEARKRVSGTEPAGGG